MDNLDGMITNHGSLIGDISEEPELDGQITNEDSLTGEPNQCGYPGPPGPPGEDGYTPQRGIDYWTEEDKTEIKDDLKSDVVVSWNERKGDVVPESGDYTLEMVGAEILTNTEIDDIWNL